MGSRKSINITEEALSIGKLPTEVVASNIAQGQYDENGLLKQRVSVTSD